MDITILGSGSFGNGYVIQNKSEALILECGVNYKHAVEALKGNVSKVNGCLVTHSHYDHAGFIQQYARAFTPFVALPTTSNPNISQ